jgi:hypothetical protein
MTFSGLIKARERPRTREGGTKREKKTENRGERETGEELKKNRRGKQRVRPLYFIFSSSSRAPSSAATLGEKYRDELGKRTNEQRKDWTGRTRTEIQIQKTRKNTESKKNKTERRKNIERTEEKSSIDPSTSPSSLSLSASFASSCTR